MTERAIGAGPVAIDEAAERCARVLDALPEAVVCIRSDGTVSGAWGSCSVIFGERDVDVIGSNAYDWVHPDDIEYAAGALAEAITHDDEHIPINLRIRAADGRWVLTEAAAGYLGEADTLLLSLRPLAFRGHMDERRDQLKQRSLQIAARVAAAHGDDLDEALVDGVMSVRTFFHAEAARFCTPGGACIEVGELVAWPDRSELAGEPFRAHPWTADRAVIEIPVPSAGAGRWWLAWPVPDPGEAGWDGSHIADLQMVGAVLASAWARLSLERDLVQRSRHDPLTGLANRAELERALQAMLDDGPVTVLFCDLDGYKLVNDQFGHRTGDRVLAAVADRLRSALRADDLLARVGGDEFVAVCPAMPPGEEATLVSRLEATLASPIRLGDVAVSIGVSIGAATGSVGSAAGTVIGEADGAMYAAKALRRSRR